MLPAKRQERDASNIQLWATEFFIQFEWARKRIPISDVILTWYSLPCKLRMENTLESHTYKDCMLKPFCLWKFIIGQLKTDMFSTLKPHACTLCQMFSLINIKWSFLLETGSRLALDKMVSSLLALVVVEAVV